MARTGPRPAPRTRSGAARRPSRPRRPVGRGRSRRATSAPTVRVRRGLPVVAASVAVGLGALGAGWASPSAEPATPDPNPPTAAAREEIPPHLLARYRSAAAASCLGDRWNVLAGIGRVETDHHRNRAVSSAGARGPMQFMPATWDAFGVDGDGDGRAEITDPDDAIPSAARYLCHNGAGDLARLRQALWHYNHADWYVELVLGHAARYGELPPVPPRR